jgi:hypothetical protein
VTVVFWANCFRITCNCYHRLLVLDFHKTGEFHYFYHIWLICDQRGLNFSI